MLYVSNGFRQAYRGNENRLNGVTDAGQLNSQQARKALVAEVAQEQKSPLKSPGFQGESRRSPSFGEDRRKVNQRIYRRALPVECRSGRDRRSRHQRESDVIERISIIA